MTCSALTLARYLADRLTGDELLACLDHIRVCPYCFRILVDVHRWLDRDYYQRMYHPLLKPAGFGALVLEEYDDLISRPLKWRRNPPYLEDDPEIDALFENALTPNQQVYRQGCRKFRQRKLDVEKVFGLIATAGSAGIQLDDLQVPLRASKPRIYYAIRQLVKVGRLVKLGLHRNASWAAAAEPKEQSA